MLLSFLRAAARTWLTCVFLAMLSVVVYGVYQAYRQDPVTVKIVAIVVACIAMTIGSYAVLEKTDREVPNDDTAHR